MGFLDKIFGKGSVKAEEARITSKDLESFLGNEIKKDFGKSQDSITREHDNLKNIANVMRGQLKMLEDASYSDRAYPVIVSKSIVSRKNFTTKMGILVEQINKPVGKDMTSVIAFYEELDKLVNSINSETIKDYAFLKMLFEKEGKDVVESFRQIKEANGRINETLKPITDSNKKIKSVGGYVTEIASLDEELNRKETDKISRLAEEKSQEMERTQKDLKSLIESNEWKSVLDMQASQEEMKSRMKRLISQFSDAMSRLEAPMKKYRRANESKLLGDYIDGSFSQALCEDPRGERFLSILSSMKDMLVQEKLGLKESGNFMVLIDDFKESNTIGKIFLEYSSSSERLAEIEKAIDSDESSKKKSRLERELVGIIDEIERAMGNKKRSEELAKRLIAKKEQKIKELGEFIFKNYGKRVLIEP